jgi:hypothetical protein
MSGDTTPAVERAADLLIHEADTTGLITDDVRNGLAAALDVDEITETLARTQWNMLPLVVRGEMPEWDDEESEVPRGVARTFERQHFRRLARPFAEAVRAALLGDS